MFAYEQRMLKSGRSRGTLKISNFSCGNSPGAASRKTGIYGGR